MKKLFTLIAFLTCFLGANAKEIVDAEVDFSKYSDISEWNFPFSWGGSESARARLSIQDGCLHFESSEATDPSWDCQFFPIGMKGAAEVDVTYTLHFKIKGDHEENVSMLGFGQTPYGAFPITTEWVEGTVDYVCTGTDGNILMQCGSYVGTWDIAYLKITHEGQEEPPVQWAELLANGNAETPWGDLAEVRFDDTDKNYTICAWSKEKGHNMNDDGGWDPFPAGIEEEADGNHVFVCHGQVADTEGDASAWDNQFWIQSPQEWKAGQEFQLSFRYKASQNVTTNTQFHLQTPSNYKHWQAIGDISFTQEWQTYEGTVTVPDAADGSWSIAFNLNSSVKDAVDFYFDDLSWQKMVLEEGFFVASSNPETGIEYNFNEAIPFEDHGTEFVAVVGTTGKQDSWVTEAMVSTVRGNSKAFKAGTIKPTDAVVSDPETWVPYESASNYKIKFPAAGVWQISVDTYENLINFVMLEGGEIPEPIDIKPNATEIVVHGKAKEANTWDNQFWIVANEGLDKNDVTWLEFDYWIVSDEVEEARVTTQYQGEPQNWIANSATEDLTFTTEKQHFEGTVEIKNDGVKSIAFNMAEIDEAADYYITNVVWKLKDGTKTLINMEGAENFWMVEGYGDELHQFGKEPGSGGKKGDLTDDGKVNGTDIQKLINFIVDEEDYDEKFDINGDGKINGTDIQELVNIIVNEE